MKQLKSMEESPSGLWRRLGKAVYPHGYRGFKSHLFRNCINSVRKKQMKGFLEFIREQGVVGLAVGFILGGAVSKVVAALVDDVVNPLVGLLLGRAQNLSNASFMAGSAEIKWGDFVSVTIDFIIVALVVYFGVKGLKLDKLDKKKA